MLEFILFFISCSIISSVYLLSLIKNEIIDLKLSNVKYFFSIKIAIISINEYFNSKSFSQVNLLIEEINISLLASLSIITLMRRDFNTYILLNFSNNMFESSFKTKKV